jgi:death-on-curing protein
MPGIVWLEEAVILAVHEAQLAEHGGCTGVRDPGLLQSAFFRPRNREAYGQPDIAELAATYGCGIIDNHPFLDGNKRAGYVTVRVFLSLNGWWLTSDMAERYMVIMQLAAGRLSEAEFAAWIRKHISPVS